MPEKKKIFGRDLEELIESEEARRKQLEAEADEKKRKDDEDALVKHYARLASEASELNTEEGTKAFRTYQQAIKEGGERVLSALVAFHRRADFEKIVRFTDAINNSLQRLEYIDRLVFESGLGEVTSSIDGTRFHYELQNYGIFVMCPYLLLDEENKTTGQYCHVGDTKAMCACTGFSWESCAAFKEMSIKFAEGRGSLSNISPAAASGRIRIKTLEPLSELEQAELQEILSDTDDWWRMEGKYS